MLIFFQTCFSQMHLLLLHFLLTIADNVPHQNKFLQILSLEIFPWQKINSAAVYGMFIVVHY
jgi:hypothetical protein